MAKAEKAPRSHGSAYNVRKYKIQLDRTRKKATVRLEAHLAAYPIEKRSGAVYDALVAKLRHYRTTFGDRIRPKRVHGSRCGASMGKD